MFLIFLEMVTRIQSMIVQQSTSALAYMIVPHRRLHASAGMRPRSRNIPAKRTGRYIVF